jgi:hypothetical protein
MDDILLKSFVEKLSKVDESIQQVKSEMPQIPDHSGQLKAISATLEQAKADIARLPELLKFPAGAIYALSQHLEINNDLLKRPPKQEIRHHHHIHTGLVVCGVLFLSLAVVCMWLFNTHSKLEDYKAGDIKYRYLQLRTNKPLRSLLSLTDSLYHADREAFRDSVIKSEEEQQRIRTLLLEAQQKEIEAGRLREKAGKEAVK